MFFLPFLQFLSLSSHFFYSFPFAFPLVFFHLILFWTSSSDYSGYLILFLSHPIPTKTLTIPITPSVRRQHLRRAVHRCFGGAAGVCVLASSKFGASAIRELPAFPAPPARRALTPRNGPIPPSLKISCEII